MGSYTPKGKPEARLFINGEFVESKSGKKFDVHNPATEVLAASVYEAGAEDVDLAVKAAEAAFEGWDGIGATARSGHLVKLAEAIEQIADELDYLDAICMGKPVADCTVSFLALVCSDLTIFSSLQRVFRGFLSALVCRKVDGCIGNELSEQSWLREYVLETAIWGLRCNYSLVSSNALAKHL